MNILDIVRLYLLIGVVAIGIEWIILSFEKRGILFEYNYHDYPRPIWMKITMIVSVFMIEICIWPRQVFVILAGLFKVISGKCSNKDIEEYGLYGRTADFATRNRKEI